MSEHEVTCFCITEITEIKKLLLNIAALLPKARAQYDKYKGTGLKREYDSLVDLHRSVKRMLNAFPTLLQQLNEYGDSRLTDTTVKLYTVLKGYDYLGVADYTPLCQALTTFAGSLPDTENEINTAAIGRLMNRVRMGYFPTDPDHVDVLRRAIQFPEEPVNVIDPCCGEGLALARFTHGTNAVTYGVEIDTVRGEEAQSRIRRVGFGSFFHSRISSNAFQSVPLPLNRRWPPSARRKKLSWSCCLQNIPSPILPPCWGSVWILSATVLPQFSARPSQALLWPLRKSKQKGRMLMINPIEFLIVKIRLYLASRRTAAAKRAMEHSIQHTRDATADIDQSYACFLEKARQQEELAVQLRRLRSRHSSLPFLEVSVNTGSVSMTGPAEQALTKLDTELALTRHRHGDWGSTDPHRWRQNNQAALSLSGRICSRYDCFGNKRFQIITDCDKQTTQICMEGEAWR